MIEISRQEHIKELIVMDSLCAMTTFERKAIYKAISDMRKLEKIEKIVKCVDGICLKSKDECFDCMFDKLEEIEKIVEGE